MDPDSFKVKALCVDLDGTFCRTETAIENVLLAFRRFPFRTLHLIIRLLVDRNIASFKGALFKLHPIDFRLLPVSGAVKRLVESARAEGVVTVLATAAPISVATGVAEAHPIFDRISASDETSNNKGARKAHRLTSEFPDGDFGYAGDAKADIPVWNAARQAYVVAPGGHARRDLLAACPGLTVLPTEPHPLRAFLKALRPHQWSKNLLVFIPAVAAFEIFSPEHFCMALLAFCLVGMTASAGYLINDCFDVEEDRRHPTKKNRPCASGDLPVRSALTRAFLLIVVALGVSLLVLPGMAAIWLAVYLATSLAYTLWCKSILIFDVVVLSFLYTVRLLIGSAATGIEASHWLLGFSGLCFLSLAFLKRFAEVKLLVAKGARNPFGRSYHHSSALWLPFVGGLLALSASLSLVGYAFDDRSALIYSKPLLVALACPIVGAWFLRMWLCATRGKVSGDPVLFALKDWGSYAALAALTFIAIAGK